MTLKRSSSKYYDIEEMHNIFKKIDWNLLLLTLLPLEKQMLLFKSFTDSLYGPY